MAKVISHWRIRLNLPWFVYLLVASLGAIATSTAVDITDKYFECAALVQLRGLL